MVQKDAPFQKYFKQFEKLKTPVFKKKFRLIFMIFRISLSFDYWKFGLSPFKKLVYILCLVKSYGIVNNNIDNLKEIIKRHKSGNT